MFSEKIPTEFLDAVGNRICVNDLVSFSEMGSTNLGLALIIGVSKKIVKISDPREELSKRTDLQSIPTNLKYLIHERYIRPSQVVVVSVPWIE